MSHVPERKEKDCLNCGTTVVGKYCHVCGQENVVPRETFWSMFIHFFYDITHFDSKFFETVKDLIIRPGFLSREFIKGKRASYLHPIRMYVFTSAIFFLIFFSFFKPADAIKTNIDLPIPITERQDYIKTLEKKLKKDSNNVRLKTKLMCAQDTNCVVTIKDLIEEDDSRGISLGGGKYKTTREYDSLQKALPSSEQDGWLMRNITHKSIEVNNRFKENPEEAKKEFIESVLHRLPYMLFVSLPLFALLLKLVYIRRKQYYYADHGVFTIHLYVFTFLWLLIAFSLDALRKATGWGIVSFVSVLLYISLFFYLYKAMRNFYQQRRLKTFFKFFLVTIFSLIMMMILFLLFISFSAATF